MTTSPNAAAPDPVKVAREACANRPAVPVKDRPRYLSGALDRTIYVMGAILGARAMQEAMSAQGGGEEPWAWQFDGMFHWPTDRKVIHPGGTSFITRDKSVIDAYDLTQFSEYRITPLYARPAPEVKDAPACAYCGTATDVRISCDGYAHVPPEYVCEGCFKAADDGPSFDDLPPPTTPAPAAASEVLDKEGKRLCRQLRARSNGDGPRNYTQVMSEDDWKAAARIEADAAEMERWKDWYGQSNKQRNLAEAKCDAMMEALAPFARLEIPTRPHGNAGAYSILHKDIEAARAALRPEAKGGRDGE